MQDTRQPADSLSTVNNITRTWVVAVHSGGRRVFMADVLFHCLRTFPVRCFARIAQKNAGHLVISIVTRDLRSRRKGAL